MTFSDKIKLARENAKLTQAKLAEAVGVSQRTIASYESTDAHPHASTMKKLATVLNVSYDYLQNDSITNPTSGIEKDVYVDQVRNRFGNKAASDFNGLLDANKALFAGGELSQEAKDDFFAAVAKAYLMCKEEAQRKYSRKSTDQ